MTKKQKEAKILGLRKKRDDLWREFTSLPRRSSFSGIDVSGRLNKVQQELDKLEGDIRSKRYYTEINIEIG